MRFVLIDELLELVKGERARARKFITPDAEYFQDHFPGFPIVPGVLLTESMAQTGGWLLAYSHNFQVKSALLMIERAKFRHWVEPGETIEIEAVIDSLQDSSATVKATVKVDGKRRATAQLMYGLNALNQDAASPFNTTASRQWVRATWEKLNGPALVAAGEGPQ